jgi:DNA adenine methylase
MSAFIADSTSVPVVPEAPEVSVTSPFAKPLLKWVGGKTQILSSITARFPAQMQSYREIFVGGGSVLLALLSHVRAGLVQVHGDIYAYDANEPLIGFYQNVQKDPEGLLQVLQEIIEQFYAAKELDDDKGGSTYYYKMRTAYNELDDAGRLTLRGSAMLLFLNKTCFRGLFRMGPHGFNVPYGNYARPTIVDHDALFAVHDLIQPVVFECADFTDSFACVESGDFVYLDPPYPPPDGAKGFTNYTARGFSEEQHRQLFQYTQNIAAHARILMSNADVQLVRDYFGAPPFHITPIICRRAINSKNPDQTAKEVLIDNIDV